MTLTNKSQIPLSALLTGQPATTPSFVAAHVKMRAVASNRSIMAIDGEPGTGKTTCAVYTADVEHVPAAVVTMTDRPAPLDVLRYTYAAITGSRAPKATHYELGNEVRDLLAGWGGILVVDELQNCRENAMQELVWLHETTQGAFTLVVVGSGVHAALRRYPQLRSRVMAFATFERLVGADMIRAARKLHPTGFADTDDQVLHQHDAVFCRGLMRDWKMTVNWLTTLHVEGPVTAQDLARVRESIASGDRA